MNKKLLLFLLILLPLVASAQTKRTIHVATAGTLSDYISEDEKYQIEELTLTGELNGTDIRFIRNMSGIDYDSKYHGFTGPFYYFNISTPGILKILDISDTKIIGGGDWYYAETPYDRDAEFECGTGDNIISGYMFYKCGLTSIRIPNSVTSVENDAFGQCSGLTSIIIPNNVTSIGSGAFSGCIGLTSLTLPTSVTSIGNSAFSGCSGLTTVTIPNSMTSIGWYVFDGCTGLTSIIIPNSVTSIGLDAFRGTGWYNNQPDGLVYAGKVAYGYKGTMPANTSISLNEGTLGIAGGAFASCSSLTSISIPSSVTSIREWAFYGCSGLISLTLPNSVTSIGENAFSGCRGLTSLTLPSSVTSIGWDAFLGCSGLISVTIPNSVTNIGSGAFRGCSGLTSITIPNSVTSIEPFTFEGCSSLISLTLPNSVTSIGGWAFSGCSGLTTIISEIENPFEISSIELNGSDKDIYATATLVVPLGKKSVYQNTAGWNKFTNIVEAGQGGIIGREFESDGIRYKIGENNTISVVSRDAKYAGAVSIPNQVAFNDNNYTVTSIAQSAFEGCIDMTSVTIPGSVTTIGGAAFYYCTGLTTVDIPNGVKTIGEGAFSKCEGLTSVTIPSSVTSIGKNAFFQCYGLTQITSGIENPFAIDDGVFPTSVYNNASLLVPSGKRSAYQNTAGWKRFRNIVEASAVGKEFEANGVRYLIGENSTVSVTSKTGKYAGAVSIPSQVYYDGNNYTVTSIAQSAFEGCVDMTSVSIPGSVTTIGDAAFYYCTGLTTVEIPNGVKTIGEGAFSKCGGLTSVTIPSSVTSIGKNAFFQCYGLTQITSGIETPFAIDNGVFPTSVYNNASLLVPSGKKSAYQNTAGWKRFQNIYYVDGVYTLTYYVDGVEYKSATYSYGAGIIPEAEPIREGYTFSGWSYIPETMPAEEVNVTGYFTINQYTITYVIDGEEYATEMIDFGSKVDPPTPPSKDGFDFAWEEYPETMPAHDITINGAYTTTGILSIAVESGKAKIFTLDGRQVDAPQKGINIIRMDDGFIKKVVLGKEK